MAGFFGIGIYHSKNRKNIGTLWRSAQLFEASFVFTILMKYKWQPTDTLRSQRNIPFYHHPQIEDLINSMPADTVLVGVELTDDAIDIMDFTHPKRAVYLLGAEETGLPAEILARCSAVIRLPGKLSMNVSTAGTLVMYDRYVKFKNSLNAHLENERIHKSTLCASLSKEQTLLNRIDPFHKKYEATYKALA